MKIGKGIEFDLDGEEVVVLIGAPTEEEIESPVEAVDMSAIEVEKKGKVEDDEQK